MHAYLEHVLELMDVMEPSLSKKNESLYEKIVKAEISKLGRHPHRSPGSPILDLSIRSG